MVNIDHSYLAKSANSSLAVTKPLRGLWFVIDAAAKWYEERVLAENFMDAADFLGAEI